MTASGKDNGSKFTSNPHREKKFHPTCVVSQNGNTEAVTMRKRSKLRFTDRIKQTGKLLFTVIRF